MRYSRIVMEVVLEEEAMVKLTMVVIVMEIVETAREKSAPTRRGAMINTIGDRMRASSTKE